MKKMFGKGKDNKIERTNFLECTEGGGRYKTLKNVFMVILFSVTSVVKFDNSFFAKWSKK